MGGLAEYVCAQEKDLALKPDGMTFQTAAAIPQAAVEAHVTAGVPIVGCAVSAAAAAAWTRE